MAQVLKLEDLSLELLAVRYFLLAISCIYVYPYKPMIPLDTCNEAT